MKLAGQRNVDWQNRGHFAIAAQIMRRILLDDAQPPASEASGGATMAALEELSAAARGAVRRGGTIAVDRALTESSACDLEQAKIVELILRRSDGRETAEVLGSSPATIKRSGRLRRLAARPHRAGTRPLQP
jgi:hypothetical protein